MASQFLKKRLKEPSTHAGLAGIIGGIGLILGSSEAVAVAGKIPPMAERLSAGDWGGALMIGFGALAVFLQERSNNK